MSWRGGHWDVITIGSATIGPPNARVLDLVVTPKRKVERTKPKGTDTPHTKDEGYEGAAITLTIEIWHARQFPELETFIETLSPKQPGAPAKPLAIRHPIALAFNVNYVYVEEMSMGMPKGNRVTLTIKMAEWFSPEKATKTNMGALDSGGEYLPKGDLPTPDPKNRGAKFP